MRLSDKTVKSISKSIAAGYCSPSIWESVYSLDYFVIMATNHLSTIMWAKSPFVCWSRLRIFLINSMISRFSSVFFRSPCVFIPTMTVVTRSAPRKTWGLPGPRRVLQEHGQQVGWGATGPGLPHGHFGGSSHEPQLGSNHSYNPFINGTTHLGDLLLGLECPEKCTDSEKKIK